MPFALGYQISFKDAFNLTYTATIYDGDSFTTSPVDSTLYVMQAAEDAITISSIDNNESKLTSVRGKKAELQFLSSNTININTFASGSDNRWYVEIVNSSATVFKGYLVLDDIQTPYLPYPQVVKLTATDNLKTLSGVPLVSSGLAPRGKYSLIQYVSWALQRTNLQLPINVVQSVYWKGNGALTIPGQFVASNSFKCSSDYAYFFTNGKVLDITGTVSNNLQRTVSSSSITGATLTVIFTSTVTNETAPAVIFTEGNSNAFNKTYLDAKTFETDINVREDCLKVLEKICQAFNCTLFQEKGEWWIVGIDEFRQTFMYADTYTYLGVPSGRTTITDMRQIGVSGTIRIINDDAVLLPTRPNVFAKETLKFEYPREIIDNMDFSRGTVTSTTPTEIRMTLDDWDHYKAPMNPSNPTSTPTNIAYIKRVMLDGYEKERYVVNSLDSTDDYLQSKPVEIQLSDKFDMSLDWRFSVNVSGSGTFTQGVMIIALAGDDGTNWSLDDDNKWYQSNSSWTVNVRVIQEQWIRDNFDETQWRTKSVSAEPAPTTGKLYFLLLNTISGGVTADMYFANVQFTYIPFINGSYQKYTSVYHKFSRTGEYKANQDVQVSIGDGVKKLLKGMLLTYDGTNYSLASDFYNLQDGRTGGLGVTRLGKIQANSLWNQYKNDLRIFQLSLLSLAASTPGFRNRYQLTDVNANSLNRYFVLVNFQQNLRTAQWTGTFIEVYSAIKGYAYGDSYEFKYITNG